MACTSRQVTWRVREKCIHSGGWLWFRSSIFWLTVEIVIVLRLPPLGVVYLRISLLRERFVHQLAGFVALERLDQLALPYRAARSHGVLPLVVAVLHPGVSTFRDCRMNRF